MKTLILSVTLLVISFLALGTAMAQSELDPSFSGAPQEIIVREDANGNREVFKVSEKSSVETAEEAALAIETYVKAENKISTLVAKAELDQVSSTEAWYYWYGNYWYGYNYAYYYYGYNYYYRPYYSYNWGYYNYYYYRWY